MNKGLTVVALVRYMVRSSASWNAMMSANKMSANKAKRPSYHVQVIDRALSVLEVLAAEGQALSLVKLSKRLGLPKSTTMPDGPGGTSLRPKEH